MKLFKTLVLALALTLTGSLSAVAQTFDWGMVAGLNLTRLKFDKGSGMNSHTGTDNKAGWFVGPKVYFNTAIGLGIDGALQYSERALSINNETEKYRTIEIPVNLRYNIGLGKTLGVYIATGPQFGFALQNMKWNNLGTGYNFSRSNMNTTWNLGVGVRALQHLEVGIGYNFALGKTGKAVFENFGGNAGESTDNELEYKANTFQIQVAYIF